MDKMVTITVDNTGTVEWKELAPITMVIIQGKSNKEIGRLDWTSGKFKFVGNADQSAEVFFEYYLKPLVDEYIESELRRKE